MKIAIVGSGYVGLCTGAGLAQIGNEVLCVDVDKTKTDKINRGIAPIYEEGLDKMLPSLVKSGKLKASNALEGSPEIIFIAVGTPSRKDGSLDTKYIESAAKDIGSFLKNQKYTVVVVKSTVLPETTEKIVIPLIEKHSGKKAGKDFGVCMNPEFLREGKAMEDFMRPDRIVIGELDKKSGDVIDKLYSNFKCPKKRTTLRTAEMIKYASNAFLATKITFINHLGSLCKDIGIDVYDVAEGMGLDKRISPHFLEAGIGFGGSCFRKDVEALVSKFSDSGSNATLLKNVLEINNNQPLKITSLLQKKMNVKNKTIAILGLAFKAGTDDIRDAPSISIINELLRIGAKIKCYDPKAAENMRGLYPEIKYCASAREALEGADACLLLTEWEEFKTLTDKDFAKMKGNVIIEGRRVLNQSKVNNFEGVFW